MVEPMLSPALRSLWDDRAGRPGRARLWSEGTENVGIDPWPTNLLAKRLETGDYGGLVFSNEFNRDTDKTNLELVLGLQDQGIGVVTNLDLERIFLSEAEREIIECMAAAWDEHGNGLYGGITYQEAIDMGKRFKLPEYTNLLAMIEKASGWKDRFLNKE